MVQPPDIIHCSWCMSYHFLSLCCDLIQEQWPHADSCQDPKPKAQRLSGTFCTTTTGTGARWARSAGAGASGPNSGKTDALQWCNWAMKCKNSRDTWDAVQRVKGDKHFITPLICISYLYRIQYRQIPLSLYINVGELLWYMLWLGQTALGIAANHGNLLYGGTLLILLWMEE